MWTGKDSILYLNKMRFFWKYLATLGVSIKNLMRERERNVEEVLIIFL